ncbi:protein ZW2 [Sesamum alatum]|uniref:Protein ZW2 n=1 Tax=Sesamum alatum TaxID=300844 RepID=A0AAE2CVX4_9LAMI|nr:protein ZW2 [Sesamum alatum]
MVLPTHFQTNDRAQTFEAFVDRWFINKERYLRDLLGLIQANGSNNEVNEVQCKCLIDQVVRHYAQYFEAQARMIAENVFLVLMPTWFSSFERAYLWMGGFRPGLAFRLVINNVLDLSEQQSGRINTLMTEIKKEEKEITDEFEKVQQVMASPSMLELLRHGGRLRNGAKHGMELLVDQLKSSLGALVECADILRMKTVIMLMEILKPAQTLRFLAAAAQLQLRLRRWGMWRDAESRMHIFETHPL